MQPVIAIFPGKKFAGKKMKMSLSANKTADLWKSFMPRLKSLDDIAVGIEVYSIEIYPPKYFDSFNPAAEFEKWAAVEVSDWEKLPEDMEPLSVPAGIYAVFTYIGAASEAMKFFQYIFGEWLPASNFILEDRPHFAVMGEKYRGESPDSEEEIWIPVRVKE